MKKMYKQPIVETAEVRCSTILTGSSVVNNTPEQGSSTPGDPLAPTAD